MKRIVVALAIAMPLVFAVSAQARSGASESIHTVIPAASFPTTPPYVQAYTGSFTASGAFNDSGTMSVEALFAAVPSPSISVLETVRTLTDPRDYTLTLRCSTFANDFSNPSDVPDRGTCAVLGGTGPYAALSGSGKLTGFADLTASPEILDETVVVPAG